MAADEYKALGGEFLIQVERAPGYSEAELIHNWLTEVLSGHEPLTDLLHNDVEGIWEGRSPEGIKHPSVSFFFYAAAEDDVQGTSHAAHMIYVITGWDEENFDRLYPIAAALYDLLEAGIGGSIERDEGTIYSCERVRPWLNTSDQE